MRTQQEADLNQQLAALKARPVGERADFLAELAQVDPAQAARLIHLLDADEPATIRQVDAIADLETRRELDSETYLQRRAQMLEQVWRGRRLGDFEVESILGQGGMGIVLAARHVETGQAVAIKMVRPDMLGPNLDLRLTRESDAMGRLIHPGIARFLGLSRTDEGRPFLIMERVDGLSLDRAVAALDLRARINLLRQIADVVGVAHAAQIVHRDLKPSNILVDTQGQVKLLDFGIAKCLDDAQTQTRTLTADRMLTPRYAAPEQIRGEAVGPGADVHALGVILVELVTACQASADAAQSGFLADQVSAKAIEDPWLRAIAETAMAPSLALRYPDANALQAELARWLAGDKPRVLGFAEQLRRHWRARAHTWVWTTVGLGMLTVAAVYGWYQAVFLERPIEAGYALIERDLVGLTGAQKQSVREAIARDAEGDRSSAIELLKAVADSHPDQPFPAILLSIWLGARGSKESENYVIEARELLKKHDAPYLSLFMEGNINQGTVVDDRRAIESALALRPSAWKLRYALSHIAIGRNEAELARQELAQITFSSYRDRRVPQVLADRALLGDCAAVRPEIARLPEDRPVWRLWVTAACDFSEGKLDAASEGFAAILNAPAGSREDSTEAMVRSAQLLTLGQGGRWAELLDQAALGYRRSREQLDVYAAHRDALMALTAAHQLGRTSEANDWLARVMAVPEFEYQVDAHVSVRLLGLPSAYSSAAMRADVVSKMATFPGLIYLLDAIEAWQAGQGEAARAAAARARREGLAETRFAPVLIALERGLGVSNAQEAVLLWFAPWSDWVASWVIEPASSESPGMPAGSTD